MIWASRNRGTTVSKVSKREMIKVKSKPTIVHICDKFGVAGSTVHGGSRLFSWWIPRFDVDGYNVQLVGLREPDQATENLRRQGIEVISLNKGKFDLSTISEIVGVVKREGPQILHLHGYGASNFGRVAARMTGVKSIVHEHFVDPDMPKYQVPCDYLLSSFTDMGIAVSKSVMDFMTKKRFIPAEKVRVVFNGAPLNEFKPGSMELIAAERKRWNIPEGCCVVGTVGRLDEQKGNKYLIEAVALLLEKGYSIKVMIVGDGPLLNALQEECRIRRISKHVLFTGYVRDIPAIQAVMDIQVFPSLWEGTPLTLFEAMSMGKAIVSTSVDGLGEVLQHDVNALVIPPRDAKALAQAIEQLLQDENKVLHLGKRAQADSERFDIGNTIEELKSIYEELIG